MAFMRSGVRSPSAPPSVSIPAPQLFFAPRRMFESRSLPEPVPAPYVLRQSPARETAAAIAAASGRPLRIAFGTQEFVTEPSFDGGIANYVHRTAQTLSALGHDVHVITLSTVDRAEFDH